MRIGIKNICLSINTRPALLRNLCWFALGLAIILLDLLLGPSIKIPILLLFPILLASWFSGIRASLFLSVIFPVIRVLSEITVSSSVPLTSLAINGGVQIIALGGLAILANVLFRKFAAVRALQGLLPICSHCKNIRTAQKQWQPVEDYITDHSEASFTHGICPECAKVHFDFAIPEASKPFRASTLEETSFLKDSA